MAIAEYSPVDLVNKPKLSVPDTGVQLPAVPGAGSATPAPGVTPQPLEGVTALPFGNGVTPPVLQAAPNPSLVDQVKAGGPGTVNIDNMSPMPGGFQPMSTVQMPSSGLPGPTNDPMVNPSAPAAGGPDDNNLLNTLIAPDANAPNPNDVAEQYRTKFAGEFTQPDISAGPLDPRAGAWNSRVDAAAGDLGNTDRRSMLGTLLDDFDKQQSAKDDNAYRASARYSAANGRTGSGMTSQDMDQIARQSLGDRQIFRNQLASDTIDKEIGDKFGKLSAFSSAGNDAFGQASSNRGFDYGVKSDNRSARTQGALNAANLAGTYADRATTTGANNRNELRTERANQQQTQQTAIDRKVQQTQVEEALKSGDFSRALQLLQAGQSGNPASAMVGAANDLSGQSSQTAQLLQQFLQSLGQRAA